MLAVIPIAALLGQLEERFTERKNYAPEKFLSPIVANDPQRDDANWRQHLLWRRASETPTRELVS